MTLICRGCLVMDSSVKEYNDELFDIYRQTICYEKFDAMKEIRLGLCVFCIATLWKLHKFKSKCMAAETFLRGFIKDGKVCIHEMKGTSFSSNCSIKSTNVFNFDCMQTSTLVSREQATQNVLLLYEDACDPSVSISKSDSTGKDTLGSNDLNTEECPIKHEDVDHLDGFDSDDDKALIKLETILKDVSKRKIPRKKRKTKVDSKEGISNVKHKKRERDKQEVAVGDVVIKEENIDGDNSAVWEDLLAAEGKEPKQSIRPVYYHFDESNIQVMKQSIDEITKELSLFRDTKSYLEAPYKCERCAKYFMTDISLSLHNQRHSESAGPMVCDICKQRYGNHRSLTAHMQTHTDRYKCVYTNNTEALRDSAGGAVCGRVFAARSAAVKHALKHTGNQMLFHCQLCGKTTNCANTHQKHVRTHSVVKKYQCPQCSKEFRNSTTRNLHVMRVHTGERHFTCPSCPMTFVNKTALVAHSIKHSSHRQFYCVECDMYFKSASILKCHLTTSAKHSDPNTFKFQCSMCPKRYPLLYRLKDHVESAHTRRGHCVCDVCGASYHTTAALRRHHRQKHQDTPRERKHKCLVCNKAFLTKQTLASHQLTHTGERPFSCQSCGRLFRHKAALWTHNKLVHNKNKN